MKRRTFLRHTTHAIGIPAMMGAFGMSSFAQSLSTLMENTDRVLVLIYLQGGNDGLNTVIPLDQLPALNSVRSNIILPENKLLNLPGTQLALHPALEGLKTLFNENRLRIIQNVGYPEQDYSHFRSTDIWMSGSDAETLVTSGWMGRYLDIEFSGYPDGYPNEINKDPLAIEIGSGSSMLFQGSNAAMSMVLKDPTAFYDLINNNEGEIPDTIAGDKLRHILLTARQSKQYGDIVKQAASKITSQQPYPENDLAQQLKIVAQLIAGGLKTPLYFVRLRGFDTHDNQVLTSDHTKGEHADLLSELDGAIFSFMRDLEYQGVDEKVTGMTFSEFGRRIISNGSLGTDHGAAAPMFIFGIQVVPGVAGNNPIIPPDATYKDNLRWEFDFKQVYGSILEQWFGSTEIERNDILFDDYDTIPVIKSTSTSSINRDNRLGSFKVYPNPIENSFNISFLGNGEKVKVDLMDLRGNLIETFLNKKVGLGRQNLSCNAGHLPAGTYIVSFQSENIFKVSRIVKLR